MLPSNASPHHHYCIAVPDLPAATAHFAATFGVEFGPVREVVMHAEGHPKAHLPQPVRFAYSTDRHLELLETYPGPGFFGDADERGFHHVGHRADVDLDEAVRHAERAGEQVEFRLFVDEKALAVFFRPTELRPVRLELLAPSPGG